MKFGSLRRFLRLPLVLVGVLAVLFEEIVWNWLGRLMAAIGRWGPVARLENVIRNLPPYIAMLVFVVPCAIIFPVKLGGLALIAIGHVKTGSVLFVVGEFLGVAVLARLYALCRASLHQVTWFVSLESLVLRMTRWAHGLLERVPLWLQAKAAARRLVTAVKGMARRTPAGARAKSFESS